MYCCVMYYLVNYDKCQNNNYRLVLHEIILDVIMILYYNSMI